MPAAVYTFGMARWLLSFVLLPGLAPVPLQAAKPAITQHDIQPLMMLRCTVCHGPRKQEGELDLRTRASMLRGGKSGPAMVPGKPGESLILKKIHAGEMPPRRKVVAASVKPMEPREIALLTKWIELGAPVGEAPKPKPYPINKADREFWAFRKPQRPAVPAIESRNSKIENIIPISTLRFKDLISSWMFQASFIQIMRIKRFI